MSSTATQLMLKSPTSPPPPPPPQQQWRADGLGSVDESHDYEHFSMSPPLPMSCCVPAPAKRQRRESSDSSLPSVSYSSMASKPPNMELTQRTAQACDRCKTRKMKCDSNPEGCANCRSANEICLQVDRMTKKRYARGEIERMQQQNEFLLQQLNALKTQMAFILNDNKRMKDQLRRGGPCPPVTSIPSNDPRRTQSLGLSESMRNNVPGLSEPGFLPAATMSNLNNDSQHQHNHQHNHNHQHLHLHQPHPRSYPAHLLQNFNNMPSMKTPMPVLPHQRLLSSRIPSEHASSEAGLTYDGRGSGNGPPKQSLKRKADATPATTEYQVSSSSQEATTYHPTSDEQHHDTNLQVEGRTIDSASNTFGMDNSNNNDASDYAPEYEPMTPPLASDQDILLSPGTTAILKDAKTSSEQY